MTPRVVPLGDLIRQTLRSDDGYCLVDGTLHEQGVDIAPARLQALADGAAPSRRELEALRWMGLPVQNTPEWLLHHD